MVTIQLSEEDYDDIRGVLELMRGYCPAGGRAITEGLLQRFENAASPSAPQFDLSDVK